MGDLSENFSRSEFACQCGCGKVIINHELVDKLQLMRDILGSPMYINSATRCEKHNKAVGGVNNSAHLSGYAVDIAAKSSSYKYALLDAAFAVGIPRIVIYKQFMHFDIDPTKAQLICGVANE